MGNIKLVVFDMAGTTVRDEHEVETCFHEAAVRSGLPADPQRILAMQGLPKLEVVQTLWDEAIGRAHPDFEKSVTHTYELFRSILEGHYLTQPVIPADGAPEVFAWLREKGVRIALTTGFYRKVTNIILDRLGWSTGLDSEYRGDGRSPIDLSLTPDETGKGRPHPDMIQRAMKMLGVGDPSQVVNLGDTPSDLLSGRAAGVRYSLGVTNGTHSREQLMAYPNDGLLDSLYELKPFLVERGLVAEAVFS